MNHKEIVRKVIRHLGCDGEGWTQGSFGIDENGNQVDSKIAVKCCIIGLFRKSIPEYLITEFCRDILLPRFNKYN